MSTVGRHVRRFSQPLSITSCTDKLRQNDPGFVELSLERMGDNFDPEDFMNSIRCNHTVRQVCFSGTFVRELQQQNLWSVILESIGYLRSLEELQIWCSSLPVAVFAHTLRHALRLRKVYLFRVTLQGSQADMDELAGAIRNHPALVDVRIGGFQLSSPSVRMSCIMEALADCRTLEVVSLQLTGVGESAPFTGDSITRLVCSPTIQRLYLSRLGLHEEHFAVIALGLMASNNLRVLDLFGNNVENEHVILLCNALERNNSLETLVLPCPSDDLSVDSCAAISKALQKNSSLITLNLPRSSLCDAGLSHLAEGLTVNTTLKKIEVGVKEGVGDKGMEALTSMLEKNFRLERLVLASAEKSVKDKVDYYMRLNEVGRGALLREDKQASREQWVEMLIAVKDDLDCLYYFTSHNPSLCQFVNASGADVIITEEFRHRRRHTINNFDGRLVELKGVEARRSSTH